MNGKTELPFDRAAAKHLESLYSLFRNYIERENTLINSRMTWLITVQSFLIATFGFSYQKRFEVLSNISIKDNATELLKKADLVGLINEYNYFLIILAFVGIVTSAAGFLSIKAALNAIGKIIGAWTTSVSGENWDYMFGALCINYLPGIAGGGDEDVVKYGKLLALFLPVFFILLWFSVILAVLIQIHVGFSH